MAAQGRARLVVDEGTFALGTGLDMPAVTAQHDRRGPAAIDRQDRLVAGSTVEAGDRGREAPTEKSAVAGSELLAKVDDLDGRGQSAGPDRQGEAAIAAIARAPDRLDRRRGAAEDDRCARELRQSDRAVARLDPRRPVALVGGVVLLVDHDHANIREWCEDRQTRADDDVDVAGPDPAPLIRSLAFPETGVDQRNADREVGPEPVDERQREGDLGNEEQRRPAAGEGRDDGLDVDRGLAATCHSVEHDRGRVAGLDRRVDRGNGGRLVVGQRCADRSPAAKPDRSSRQRPAWTLPRLHLDEAPPSQRRERCGAMPLAERGGRDAMTGGVRRHVEELVEGRSLPPPSGRPVAGAAGEAVAVAMPASVSRIQRS